MTNNQNPAVAGKPYYDFSNEEETTELVAGVEAITGNDHSKLIRAMRVFEFLIWQVVHEDLRYFTYKMRKGLIFLLQGMKG